MTLRGRIAGAFLVVTLLVGGLVLVALQDQRAGAERAAIYEAHHIARAIAIAGGPDSVHEPATLRRYLAQFRERDDRTVYVVDAAQRVVASYDPRTVGTVVREAPAAIIAQVLADGIRRPAVGTATDGAPERLLVAPLRAVPTDPGSAVTGALVVEYTDLHDTLVAEANADAARLAAVAIAVVLLIALLGIALASAIATPIAALTRGAARLAGGDYDVEVPVTTRDEVGRLAAAFNAMARELRASHAQLVADHDELEARVAERTAAWQDAAAAHRGAADELRDSNAHLSQINQRLRETQDQLLQAEKMASIGQLASGVAHEINNPIGYVYSNLGTLDKYFEGLLALLDRYAAAEGTIADAAARADIARAKQAADIDFVKQDLVALLAESREGITRVKKIVQDLRNFSRTAGDEPWQPADLVAGIESTLNIVWNELKYKAEVVRDYAPLPPVECRPSQVNQVFMNLLVNAAQAIRERGTIRIATGVAGDFAWVEVSDTGEGIRPEHLSRVFDPFFTTKAVGQGTGLGLALSYRIVDEHHGRIEVASEVGVGTRFRVYLPIRQPEPAPA
ncbi:MAG: ATP-binding protein [Burkholderiales bacterium]